VKLLRANGLRDVERMREEELRDALGRLHLVVPDPGSTPKSHPSSGAFLARPAEPPPIVDDSDDPHALPRFREPKLKLPDEERTFLRAIAVKPRLVFCTWDVNKATREGLEGPVELWLFWRDFLGDAPAADDVARQEPSARVAIELAAGGWYVTVPGDRLAIAAALVVASSGRRIVTSNVSLAPPARPAPPGPLWMATLPPSLDRRKLSERKLMKGEVGDLQRLGEADARNVLDVDMEEPLPASQAAVKIPGQGSPSSSAFMWHGHAPAGAPMSAPMGAATRGKT
jgi:hypothetical protein